MKINYKRAIIAMMMTCGLIAIQAQNLNPVSNSNNVNIQNQNDHPGVPDKRTCGTEIMPQQFEEWLQSVTPAGGGKGEQDLNAESIFNIPVIVHVIHNGEAVGVGSNISNAQILSQIAILNKDFNGTNTDTTLIPALFKPMFGKVKINFCLAVVNPTGGVMGEAGVNRINRNTMGWTAPPYSNMTYWNNTIKPQSIWDVNRYMNMWVANIGNSLLGFATFPNPGSSGLAGIPSPYGSTTTDGVVINYTAFGDIGTASAPYNKGRTATHEIGHWLGLRHVWGDASCGTDYCNDTPTQSNSTYGCPSYPNAAGCSSPNPPGRMFMNYMDYVDDACMYMFSKDQAYRAQLIMVHSAFRAALITSTVCNLPTVNNDIGIVYVGSPTYSQVINCHNFINPVIVVKNFGANNITSVTYTYNVNGAGTQTLNWIGVMAPNTTATITLPTIFNVPNGTNGFNVSALNPNNTTDPNMINNHDNQLFITNNGVNVNTSVNPTSTVCAGTQLTLTASGATSYTWNPGNITGASAVVSPTTSTMYTVSATSGSCVTTRTVPITILPSPNLSVSNQTICTGGTATLIASGATTYSWSTSQTSPTINVSPATNTNYTITGFVGSCTQTKTVSVTVGPNLGMNLAATSTVFCSGNSATITANGASTYTWSTSSNSHSILVSPVVTTTYTVNGTAGICTGSAAITISVNPTPTINISTATSTICSGSTANLAASGASTYTWLPGGMTTAAVNVTPGSTTTYTVNGTSVGGCVSNKTITITVNAKPNVNVASSTSTVCPGALASLFATGASSYTWNPGNLSGSSVSVTPSSTTIYTVVGAAANGCTDTKTISLTVVPCTGINYYTANTMVISVYPNPFKGELTITANEEVQVIVYNALGQTMKKQTIHAKGNIDTADMPNGIYFVHAQGQNGTKIFKVVKN